MSEEGVAVQLSKSIDDFPVVSIDLMRASYRSDDFPRDWDEERRGRALVRYRKWLELKRRHPHARLAPTRDIDHFWHLHMLSPVAYVRDCMKAFGKILDHDGGFGKGEGELPALKACYLRTAELWRMEYGEPYREDGVELRDDSPTDCWHDCQDRCWHACADEK